jgi:hypothetical protein
MGVLNALAHLLEQGQALRNAEAVSIAVGRNRLALDVLHHEVRPPLDRYAAIEDGRNRGMHHESERSRVVAVSPPLSGSSTGILREARSRDWIGTGGRESNEPRISRQGTKLLTAPSEPTARSHSAPHLAPPGSVASECHPTHRRRRCAPFAPASARRRLVLDTSQRHP